MRPLPIKPRVLQFVLIFRAHCWHPQLCRSYFFKACVLEIQTRILSRHNRYEGNICEAVTRIRKIWSRRIFIINHNKIISQNMKRFSFSKINKSTCCSRWKDDLEPVNYKRRYWFMLGADCALNYSFFIVLSFLKSTKDPAAFDHVRVEGYAKYVAK